MLFAHDTFITVYWFITYHTVVAACRTSSAGHGQHRSRGARSPQQTENPHLLLGNSGPREHPLCYRLLDRRPLVQHRMHLCAFCTVTSSCRYAKDAATARRLGEKLDKTADLLAARSDEKELNAAFVWELAAQAIMYILSCIAIVFACFTSAHRLRQLNAELEKRSVEADSRTSAAAASADATLITKKNWSSSTFTVSSANAAVRAKVREKHFVLANWPANFCKKPERFVTIFLPQIQSISRVALRLIAYSIWLILAFLARVLVYGILALGYSVGPNPQCQTSPAGDCDSCQSSLYVLTVTLESVPSMSVEHCARNCSVFDAPAADTSWSSSSASPYRKSPRCILWVCLRY